MKPMKDITEQKNSFPVPIYLQQQNGNEGLTWRAIYTS